MVYGHRLKPYPFETTSIISSLPFVTLLLEVPDECPLRSRQHSARLGPNFPRGVEHPRGREGAGIGGVDAVLDPLFERVLVGKILLAGLRYAFRHVEAVTLPFETPVDHPAQDRRMLGHELLGKADIGIRNYDVEWRKHQSPPDRFVHRREAGLVVAGDDDLVRRIEVEVVLPHEATGERIAAGQHLEFGFVPTSPFLSFLRDDETHAFQSRNLSGMTVIL